jgi:hypothetical protein
MKRRYGCLAVLLVVLLPPLVIGLSFYYPSLLHLSAPHYTHHYRLTLEVEADGLVHTGSGVIEVVWRYRGTWGTPNLYDAWYDTVRGQAVAVDLGRRGLLLARLEDEGYFGGAPIEKVGQIVVGGAIAGTPPPADVENHIEDWLLDRAARRALGQLEGRRLAIPPNVMPSLVWLPDARDPRSAVPVPNADSLGTLVADAHLRGAWIELTDDRVTTDLFERLPWLAQRYQSEKSSGRSESRGVLELPAWSLTRQIEP